mgnify:CR=1 FL=1
MDDAVSRILENRMDGHGRKLAELDGELEKVKTAVATANAAAAAHNERLNGIEKSVNSLADNVKSLRNTLITFALTVAGSAIAVLLGLTQISGS